MSETDDYKFFRLRKEAMTYISKLFTWGSRDEVGKRNVTIVFDGNDELKVGEIEGAMCLRLSGKTRRTQVTALVTQDHNEVRRITLQTFKPRAGDWVHAEEKEEFSFRDDEFQRLLDFLEQIKFVNLENKDRFQIEDISTGQGTKIITDAEDHSVLTAIKKLNDADRSKFLASLRTSLSEDEVNLLLGRRDALKVFSDHIRNRDWAEKDWQQFFEAETWVFGYGLDYRFQNSFDREMTLSSGGTDNQNKAIVDFLQTFRDYTALVEIKRPDTPIFKQTRGGRAGTWDFSAEFIGAVSQVVEQKAKWLAHAHSGEMYDKSGTKRLVQRTRNSRTILVVGSDEEFKAGYGLRDENLRRDTFELFRQETRTIDIITYDELFERAKFIVKN